MEKELFSVALGIWSPLYIDGVEFDTATSELHIHVDFHSGGHCAYSEYGTADLPVHDTQRNVSKKLTILLP